MTDDQETAYERKRLALSYAAENRRSEIAYLWSRSLYFWGFITVVIVAYGTAVNSEHSELAVMTACFGSIASLCWTLSLRSSKFWQVVWEKKVEALEQAVLGMQLFPQSHGDPFDEERHFWGPKRYSPSKLALAVSDMTVVAWAVLIIVPMLPKRVPYALTANIIAVTATAAYAFVILYRCQSGHPLSWATIAERVRKRRLF